MRLSHLRAIAGLPATLLAAERESRRLVTDTDRLRAERAEQGLVTAAFDAATGESATMAAADVVLFDLPGSAPGDEFDVVSPSDIAGVPGLRGTAVLEALDRDHLKIVVDGSIGPVSKRVTVEAWALDAHVAEFRVSGFGESSPLLAHVVDASRGRTAILPVGSPEADELRVQATDAGLLLGIPVGHAMSTITLHRTVASS